MIKFRFLALLIVLFSSCSKDENPTPEPLTFDEKLLVKTWTYETLQVQGTTYQYDHNPNCNKDYFAYKNNKEQVYQYEESFFTNTICTGNQTILTWKPEGNHINFYFGTSKVDTFEVISLTENLFTFAINRDVDNDGKKEKVIVTATSNNVYNSSKIKANKIQNLKTFPIKLSLKML